MRALRTLKWTVIALALVAGAALLLLARSPEAKGTPGTFAPEAWPAGATATYAIAWKTDADVQLELGGQARSLGTHLDLDGELTLRSYGAKDGAVAIGCVLSRVGVARAEAMGKPATDTPEQLAAELRAAEAVLVVETDGHVRELGFSPSTTPLARDALRALLLEYTAEVGAQNGRTVVDTALGRARVEERKRVGYDDLDALRDGFDPGHAKVDRSGAGTVRGVERAVSSIAAGEDVVATAESGPVTRLHATTSLTATLLRTGRDKPEPLPSFAPLPLRGGDDDPAREEQQRRASLERRSLGVTRESVFSDVQAAAALPQKTPTAWIWHDAAFLELHPEQTSLLLDRAMKEPSLAVRAAAVDIVVVSGTDAAQRALMHTFDTAPMTDDDREVLFQHLGQLHRPRSALLAWAEVQHRASRGGPLWLATSYALGAFAWRSATSLPEISTRFVTTLEGELASATSDVDREIAIRALGNAGANRSLAVLAPHATSPRAEVRGAVAGALRRIEGEASVDLLLQLVTDPDDFVSRDAVESLYRKNLEADDWLYLAKAIDEDRIHEATHAILADGALLRRDDDPESGRLFAAMRRSPKVSVKLKQRLESVAP